MLQMSHESLCDFKFKLAGSAATVSKKLPYAYCSMNTDDKTSGVAVEVLTTR